eukprot:CAMPEP_0119109198 /NCGR_PEP_ID=MMETSP1180-20130426/17659_1 /TAXON_ID=3052 ORGANISM="Chlamydomonas cf sp, Strain CCMP681" /NCGR_SAMPLE_ID=MMETSP1180 /ASSEMBLY_ACC=CAM_ASM_000741 /LENGTH=126 /DNA_ID=CAMNT_0007094925 /DNA_START=47 /DNA_END=424 /DNA_ORIENTATION=+
MQLARSGMQHVGASMWKSQRAVIRASATVRRATLKENVSKLPGIAGIRTIRVPAGNCIIEAKPGKLASISIYSHLAAKYLGTLTPEAVIEGLALYAEVVADAEAHPGAHPNIDLLLKARNMPDSDW